MQVGRTANLLDGYDGVRPEETRLKAREAAFRALEIAPELAEVQTSLGKFKFEQEWDWAGAKQAYEKALELDPNYALAHFWNGNYLAAMNQPDGAVREIRKAVELEPDSLIFNAILGLNLIYARDYEVALKQLQETIKMDPNFVEAREDLGFTYLLLGRQEEAIAELEKFHELRGESQENLAALRAAFQSGGMPAYWQKEKEQLNERFSCKPPALRMARLCALLGEKDKAFVWLDQACDERRHYLKYINVDPTFKSWLLTLTRWRIADQLRKRAKAGVQASTEPQHEDTARTSTVERLPDPAGLDLESIWKGEWEKHLLDVATSTVKRQVDPEQYQLFDFHVLKQWPAKKVASKLGVPLSQVYFAKYKVSGLLTKELKKLEQEVSLRRHTAESSLR